MLVRVSVFSEHWCEGFFTWTAKLLPVVAIVKFLGQLGSFNRNVKSYFVKDTSRQTEDKFLGEEVTNRKRQKSAAGKGRIRGGPISGVGLAWSRLFWLF